MGKTKDAEGGLYVVTGCDSGIGKNLALLLARAGYAVLAGCLNPSDKIPDGPPAAAADGYRPFKLDLRSPPSIEAFAGKARELARSHRLRGLIHCAGTALISPAESVRRETFDSAFDVNFFGMAELNRLLIPACIAAKAGIYVTTSTAAKIALPYFSPYSASKAAAESYAVTLRRELSAFGVKVVIIAPRSVATPIWDATWRRAEAELLPSLRDEYRIPIVRGAKHLVAQGNGGLTAERAAEKIFRIVLKKRPGRRYVIAKRVLPVYLASLLPAGLQDRIIRRLFR